MADIAAVKAKAESLRTSDDTALTLRVGMLTKMAQKDRSLTERLDVEPVYDSGTMGPLEDLKAVGRNILKRWNKELHGLVCGASTADTAAREEILKSLSMGEAAVIAAVATALIGLAVPAPIAAAAAPFIVRRFIWPAKDELCQAWGEAIKAEG